MTEAKQSRHLRCLHHMHWEGGSVDFSPETSDGCGGLDWEPCPATQRFTVAHHLTTTLFLSLLFLTNVNGETRPWMTVVCTCSGDEVGKQFSGLQCSCQCTLDAGLSKHSVPDAYRFPCAAKLNGDLLHVWDSWGNVKNCWEIGINGIAKQLQPRVQFVRTCFCYVVRHAPKRALEMWQGRKSAPERQTFRSRCSFAKLVSDGSNFKPSTEPIV